MTPLLTLKEHALLIAARRNGAHTVAASLDLYRTVIDIEIHAEYWTVGGKQFPYMENCKERTIYHWNETQFEPVARYTQSLIKLVPTQWGAPTFEIDGIKMLPTAKVSPYEDAQRKVKLIDPPGKVVLDTCGGLGYFAACCVEQRVAKVLSYEKNPDVIWLRSINPWSPATGEALTLVLGDVTQWITTLPDSSVDAALHDPPRFGIAGELYSQAFYDQLARVIKRRGKLFHYTGTPNKLTSGRNVPNEVSKRLQQAGFATTLNGDGVLAYKK